MDMFNVEELETAVESLPEEEYRRFRRWFLEKDWGKWDAQIEEDSRNGRLDFLVRETLEAKEKNQLKEL
jgi:hypothetical protein